MATKLVSSASGFKVVESLFDHLVRSETRLYNGADAVLRPRGLVTSQLEFLRYLHDHPGARAADVADYFAVGVGATSKGIGRLEAKGWITRTPNPDDARSSLLWLTRAGEKLLAGAWADLDDFLASRLAQVLTKAELRTVEVALGRVRAALEADGIGTPSG